MKHLQITVEANDIVRAGQRRGIVISHDKAKQLLQAHSLKLVTEVNTVVDQIVTKIVTGEV